MMNFYDKLASDQGGLNAQQQQAYGQAQAAYAAASASMAQGAYLMSQTRGQNIKNTADQNQLNLAMAKQQSDAQNKSNAEYNTMTYGQQGVAQPAQANTNNGYDNFVHRTMNFNPMQDARNWIGNAINPLIH
jgi:leucyl aminopeptidase (aminopeptidase T)